MPTIKFDDDIIHTYNSFKKIQKLENYNEITYLNCCWNNLSNLPPELPNSLTELWCNDNTLYNLPELPDSLTFLYCSNNNLSSLSELPHSLTHLYVYNNNLSSLPELPQSLTYLYCDNNILSDLPELPKSLIFSSNKHNNKLYDDNFWWWNMWFKTEDELYSLIDSDERELPKLPDQLRWKC